MNYKHRKNDIFTNLITECYVSQQGVWNKQMGSITCTILTIIYQESTLVDTSLANLMCHSWVVTLLRLSLDEIPLLSPDRFSCSYQPRFYCSI